MGIGNLFKSWLGAGGEQAAADPVEYKGFVIEASPLAEDGKYRSAGYISGDLDGETKRVRFIRADQNSELRAAVEHSQAKARQIIDEQGPALLQKSHL